MIILNRFKKNKGKNSRGDPMIHRIKLLLSRSRYLSMVRAKKRLGQFATILEKFTVKRMQFINLERILITFSFLIPRDNRCNQIPSMKHTRNRDHYRETIVANQNVAVFRYLIDDVRHGTIVSLCYRSYHRPRSNGKKKYEYIYKTKIIHCRFFNKKINTTFRSIAQVPSPLIEGLFFSREKKTVFNGTVIEHDDHWR